MKLLSDYGVDTAPIRWVSSIGSRVLEILVAEDRYDHVLANVTRMELKVYSHFDPSTPPDRRPGSRPFSEAEKDAMKAAFKKRVTNNLHLRRSRFTGKQSDPVSCFYQRMASACPWFESIPVEEEARKPPSAGGRSHT